MTTYASQPFTGTSITNLSEKINAYFTANPTYVPISISNVTVGAGMQAIVLYSA